MSKRENKRPPTSSMEKSSSSTLRRLGQVASVVLAFLVLSYRLFALISTYAVNIFYWDQWDFDNATLFEKHSMWEMFSWQHGPHRQGLGALLGWLIEPLFHWNSRVESFGVGCLVVLSAILALWLKTRLYGKVSYSDVIIALVFLHPLQFESVFVTANLAHGPLPVLLMVLYCLAWTIRNLGVRYALVLTINFLTIYTGFGLFLGLLTPVLLAFDHWVNLRDTKEGKIYFSGALLIALVSFGSFFVGYKSQPAVDCFTPQVQVTGDYAWYVALMFAPFFGLQGITTLPRIVGAAALCTLLMSLWISIKRLQTRSTEWSRYAVIATLISYCLLFCFGNAYGRLCLGLENALTSRYSMYLNLGLLGLYLSLLALPEPRIRKALLWVFGLSLLGTIPSGERFRDTMESVHAMKQEWKNCYLEVGDAERCNQLSRIYPGAPESTHLQEKLDFLKANHQNLFAETE